MKKPYFALFGALAIAIICFGFVVTPSMKVTAPELSVQEEMSLFLAQMNNLKPICEVQQFGTNNGMHELCARSYPKKPCWFYSFGVAGDYSFEKAVVDKMNCFGFAFDPTVSYPAALSRDVVFMQVAARSLETGDQWHNWHTTTTLPALKKWFRHDNISIFKMDAEGAEFALAEDVRDEDPDFWSHIDQFAVEIHIHKNLMKSARHVYNYALLLQQLRFAGLQLTHSSLVSCGDDEFTGCPIELTETGYPCNRGQMCQNFLFSRPS